MRGNPIVVIFKVPKSFNKKLIFFMCPRSIIELLLYRLIITLWKWTSLALARDKSSPLDFQHTTLEFVNKSRVYPVQNIEVTLNKFSDSIILVEIKFNLVPALL